MEILDIIKSAEKNNYLLQVYFIEARTRRRK